MTARKTTVKARSITTGPNRTGRRTLRTGAITGSVTACVHPRARSSAPVPPGASTPTQSRTTRATRISSKINRASPRRAPTAFMRAPFRYHRAPSAWQLPGHRLCTPGEAGGPQEGRHHEEGKVRMPLPGQPLEKLGFLTIGLFDGADPGPGHETTLAVIELGERLGFDGAWVRPRHLQYGIPSPVAALAAASQRTRRIALGTAVIPLGWENPLRLAEDLATVDVLSGGRLNPGVSVGPPMHWDDVK